MRVSLLSSVFEHSTCAFPLCQKEHQQQQSDDKVGSLLARLGQQEHNNKSACSVPQKVMRAAPVHHSRPARRIALRLMEKFHLLV